MKTIVKITLLCLVFNLIQSCSKDDVAAPTPMEEQNAAPVMSAQSFEAAENITDNMPIGTVEASDPDGDALSYSISTNDNDLFEIGTTGELSLVEEQSLDFETATNHTITVAVTDGNINVNADIQITVTDVVENIAPIINAQTFNVLENIADNRPIGTVEAIDEDNDTLTFSISANDNNLFEISTAGVLSLDDLQDLDFNTAQSHTITVAVSDGTSTSEAQITVDVAELEQGAFITTWQTTNANETVIIPTRTTELNYNYIIDWGDGTTQNVFGQDGSHRYEQPGTYIVISCIQVSNATNVAFFLVSLSYIF